MTRAEKWRLVMQVVAATAPLGALAGVGLCTLLFAVGGSVIQLGAAWAAGTLGQFVWRSRAPGPLDVDLALHDGGLTPVRSRQRGSPASEASW